MFCFIWLLFSLFPTMPRHNLYKIKPYVVDLCEKHGIPYQCKTLSEAFLDIVKYVNFSIFVTSLKNLVIISGLHTISQVTLEIMIVNCD